MGDQINFTKKETPQHLSFHQSTIINYAMSNLTTLPITSAIIYEPLLAVPNLEINVHNNCILNLTDSTIEMILPQAGLKKNEKINCGIQVHTTNTTPPSNTLYATLATVTAVVSKTPIVILTESARGKLFINSAYLTVYNTISLQPRYSPGDPIIYTIELKNTGNQTAVIGPGDFIDYWHPLRLGNIIVSHTSFLTTQSQIVNTSTIRIAKDSSFIITVSATIL